MALDFSRNLFNQRDVREGSESIPNNIFLKKTVGFSSATTSGSFVDITGASVTITNLKANKTYTIMVLGYAKQNNVSISVTFLRLVIESTNLHETRIRPYVSMPKQSISVIDFLAGQTGSTSYTAKLQHWTTAGTVTTSGNIILLAIEE